MSRVHSGGGGTYTLRRTLTGLRSGGFTVRAAIPTYDVHLKDDASGALLRVNSVTGEYQFCAANSPLVAGRGAVQVDLGGVPSPQEAARAAARSAATVATLLITSDDTVADKPGNQNRLVQATFDRGSATGSATIDLTSPKRSVTIKDDTAGNGSGTCPSRAPAPRR